MDDKDGSCKNVLKVKQEIKPIIILNKTLSRAGESVSVFFREFEVILGNFLTKSWKSDMNFLNLIRERKQLF